MGYRYVVLGAGMQGTAAAFDLATHGGADDVLLLDRDAAVAQAAADRVNRLDGRTVARGGAIDVRDGAALARAFAGCHGVFSAVPFGLNPVAAAAAITARACFCDLGGNTDVVRAELALHDAAADAGVSIVPDCGLAPGLGNILAAHLVAQMDDPQHVHVRCGGLPQHPEPPLDYRLVFSIAGLTNEYTGTAEFLRDGRLVQVPTFTELELLTFPDPVGAVEAFVTSGGTSTAPETFLGRLQTYDYKTVRYRGHCTKMKAIIALGLLDTGPVLVNGASVIPRDVFHAVAAPRLAFPNDRDLVVLRVSCRGRHRGHACERHLDLLDFHDEATGFSAMERATAYPAAAVLHMQVTGRVAPGAHPPERALPLADYVAAVRARGLNLVETAGRVAD